MILVLVSHIPIIIVWQLLITPKTINELMDQPCLRGRGKWRSKSFVPRFARSPRIFKFIYNARQKVLSQRSSILFHFRLVARNENPIPQK